MILKALSLIFTFAFAYLSQYQPGNLNLVLLMWSVFCAFSLYRNSVLFQKYRLPDERYFFRSATTKRNDWISRSTIALGVCLLFYLLDYEDVIPKDALWIGTLLYGTALPFALYSIAMHYVKFADADISVRGNTVRFYRLGVLDTTIHELTYAQVEDIRVALAGSGEKCELEGRLIDPEQIETLSERLQSIVDYQLEEKEKRKRILAEAEDKLKRTFSTKIDRVD